MAQVEKKRRLASNGVEVRKGINEGNRDEERKERIVSVSRLKFMIFTFSSSHLSTRLSSSPQHSINRLLALLSPRIKGKRNMLKTSTLDYTHGPVLSFQYNGH